MTLLRGRNQEILDVAGVAEEAFVFAYPLVLKSRMMAQATAVAAPDPATMRAPLNALVQGRDTPDTVRLSGWLDLAAGPLVISVPATHGRYYVVWLRDAWNSVFASIGARTTGTAAHAFVLTGPGQHDLHLETELTLIEAPTAIVHIDGCIEAVGEPDDLALTHGRDGFGLAPLSPWQRSRAPAHPPAGELLAPVEQVERMDARAFFSEVSRLAVDNPPDLAGRAVLDRLLAITGQGTPAPDVQASLERGVQRGRDAVRAEAVRGPGELVGRWRVRYESERHGADQLRRAGAARAGVHMDPPADALVAFLDCDADGEPLSGHSRYVLRFGPDASPPTNGFWSLTAPGGTAGGAHSIGDLHGLALDRDGSLTIHIQSRPPGRKRRSNWLPVPLEPFSLALRLYWPREEALERQWKPPPVTRVE